MNLTLVSAPTGYPVNIEEVKAFCRVEDNDNDEILTTFLKSAVELAENETGRRFMPQQWRLDLDKFEDKIWLPYPNLISVDSFKYYDSANALQDVDSEVYNAGSVDGVGCITLAYNQNYQQSYQRPDAVQITYTCGYSNLTDIPTSLKNAINTITWFLFDDRGAKIDSKMLGYLLGPHIMRGFY